MSGLAPVNDVPKDAGNVTNLLLQWSRGDHSALERLTPIIYDELLRLARARLHRESGECTLEPTALVHESYLRLADQTKLQCENRAHFYAVAANVIEEIFQSALERPLSARSAYVAQACGDDAELRCEVDSLLASAGNATTALDQLVAGDLRAMVRSADASEIGLRVGPWCVS